MPKLTINGIEVEVEAGTSVLQACERLGFEVPRFCYHERLSVAGSCRMCLVEIEKTPKPVASCTMPCADGMVVHTDTPMIHKARQGVMEFLLINHPLDCPVCDQGGECDLQDLAFAYGADRSHYHEPKRVVKDKDLGPLIKTSMTRCIHCTRCIRFADEIAGTPDLGGLFRGEHLEIDTLPEKPLLSELSGNLADVCPVGALTSKPRAFEMRPWELQGTDSIDVSDAVGSNITVQTRGNEVMRILPRLNEAVNATWIHDKARYACDGLRYQRLDRPYIRSNGRLRPVSWGEAMDVAALRLQKTAPDAIAALAGDLADAEAMFALKNLMQKIGSPHLDCRQDGALYDGSERCGYVMNSLIEGIDQADAVLLIGTNPRHEAALVNARLRKRWLGGGCSIGLIGPEVDLAYPYTHVGKGPSSIRDVIEGRGAFARILKESKFPMVILGAGALARADGPALQAMGHELAEKYAMVRGDWNGFNVLQRAASRVGGLDMGFVPQAYGKGTKEIIAAAQAKQIEVVYLLGADEIDRAALGDAFVIYQGHHGDKGAEGADLILPGAAYTEKDAFYMNTEGRLQRAHQACYPPGLAREDWRIICQLADVMGKGLGFADQDDVRARLSLAVPSFAAVGDVVPAAWKPFGTAGKVSADPFQTTIANFYQTDVVSRASPTMAQCTDVILPHLRKNGEGA